MKSKKKKQNTVQQKGLEQKLLFFLFAFSVALYINTLNHGYAFDDSVAITGNKFTKQGVSGIPDLLTKDFFAGIYDKGLELGGGRYRPLSLITFAIEYELFGESPFIGHLINILLYALCVLLVYKLFKLLFKGNIWPAFIAALIFACHPIHTEVVANIKSRDEILSLLFLSITVLFTFKWLGSNKTKDLTISIVAYFLALLSKENGITFIAILPATIFCFSNSTLKESLIKSLPLIIAGIAYIIIRTSLVGIIGDRDNPDVMENPFVFASFQEKYATIIHILGKYLYMLFVPYPLSCDYSFNQIPLIGFANVKFIIPFIIYLGLIVYVIIKLKSKDIIAYSILFYLASISIVSNLVFNIGAPMGERFLFLPSVAFCFVASHVLFKLLKASPSSKPSGALLIIVVFISGAFSYITFNRNPDWKDNETLFSTDAKTVPNSAKIRYYYGNTLLNKMLADKQNPKRQEKLLLALNEVNAATKINPKFHHAHYAKGMIHQELGNADSAIAAFQEVLKLQPTHINTQSALGTVYGKLKGDFNNAIKYLTVAVKYKPDDGSAFENLGIAYAMKGDFKASLSAFEQAMRLKPESAQSYLNIAITYQNMGDSTNANTYFEKAFQIDPSLRQGK